MDNALIERAKELALRAHEGQQLYGKEGKPVSDHLAEVVRLVAESGGTAEQVAAAWLHDAVEDTELSLEDVRASFGDAVAHIVEGLTDPGGLEELSLSERKRRQAERIRGLSDDVKLVKLADQTDNCRMAATSHRTWDTKTLLEYIEGTRIVAEQCKGVSEHLDRVFDACYEDTKKKLEAELNTQNLPN